MLVLALALASVAQTDDTWVLWALVADDTASSLRLESFKSVEECNAAAAYITEHDKKLRLVPVFPLCLPSSVDPRATNRPSDTAEAAWVMWLIRPYGVKIDITCFPGTVDPRAPKGR